MKRRAKILINGIRLPIHVSEGEALKEARRRLRGVHLLSDGVSFSIHRRATDARKRDAIRFVYTVLAEGEFPTERLSSPPEQMSLLSDTMPTPLYGSEPLSARPLVVGAGPAGLFAALLLAEHGYRPLVIERGGSVKERKAAVSRFLSGGHLSTDTNIQFGAGGAGTFSDGKLVTRVKDPFSGYILDRFVSFGAPREIKMLAKPHVGTDILSGVVENMIRAIEAAGGEIRYHTRLTGIRKHGGRVTAAVTNEGEIPLGAMILAIGHSARDTYRMMMRSGVSVEPKPYSVGMRIEHLQEDIDRAMYGTLAGDGRLGHAEYNLAHNTKVRGVYTFCMCPGGEVVAATDTEGAVLTNGMSYHARDGKNANSAVLCTVFKEDYGATPEAAIASQERIERAAFLSGGGDYYAPFITVGDLLGKTEASLPTRVSPTYMQGRVRRAHPDTYLPSFAVSGIKDALSAFGRQIEGFDSDSALLTGAETRSSSPIRILRTEERRALGIKNLYPAGEGAGYAGGITSAAIDGVRCALSLMKQYKPF